MERRRLKDIIILVLVLVDLFLLISLSYRGRAARSARERAVEQLVSLFAADSIVLDPEAVSRDAVPPDRILVRDPELDRAAAILLLGRDLIQTDRGGGIHAFSSGSKAAQFRDSGVFEAAGPLAREKGEVLCRAFCKEFHYAELSAQLEDGTGTIVAVREYGGLPVYNCTVTFQLERGALLTVQGTLLPEDSTESENAEALSAQAALTAFLDMRRETGAVVSAVTGMHLCYELQSTAAAPISLTPAWCIETDTVDYYVNCRTGQFSQR